MGVASVLGGGIALKGAKMFGFSAARGVVGRTGQFIGRTADGLHDSK